MGILHYFDNLIAISIIICGFYTSFLHGLTVPLPSKAAAVFYEFSNKTGYKVAYKDNPLAWSDLKELLYTSGILKESPPQLLCIAGIWLVYPNPDYTTKEGANVKLVSGTDRCINPSDIGEIGSMQSLSSSVVTSDSSITLFSRSNFESIGHTVSELESEKGGLKQLGEDNDEIGSFMVVGEKPWSLISSKGKIICIRPMPHVEAGQLAICYGVDMIQIEDFHISAVFPDCPPEHEISVEANLRVAECKEFDSENIEPLRTAIMGRSLGSAMECHYNITWNSTKFSEEETALIAKLLTIRLTHDFENTEQLLWPDSKDDIWKTGPLDTAFEIMIATAPNEIINAHFLRMVREFTVFHLNAVWQQQRKEGKVENLKNWKSHKVLVHLLNKCLTHATKAKQFYSEKIKSSYSQKNSLEEFIKNIKSSLVLDAKNDPIIEIFWVVSNYAMALCHHLFEYKVNFWDNFITTFGHLYFHPLQSRWKTPTIISPKTFGVILSGFGVEIQHKRIAFATSIVFDLTPKLEPFEKTLTMTSSV